MKNFDENELIDKAMAGRLTVEEQRLWEALLAERPELETELEIGRALKAMPKPPMVSSNFTALVLQEINQPAPSGSSRWNFNWLSGRGWFAPPGWPWLWWASGSNWRISAELKNKKWPKRCGALRRNDGGRAKPESQPEQVVTLVQDFEAIRNLPASSDVDSSLLAALRSNE